MALGGDGTHSFPDNKAALWSRSAKGETIDTSPRAGPATVPLERQGMDEQAGGETAEQSIASLSSQILQH